jgi:hypothetical protein
MSMSEALSTFTPTTCVDTTSATSSQESADGPSPCDLQDGQMTDLFGQEVAPVSRLVWRENEKEIQMSDIFGPNFCA